MDNPYESPNSHARPTPGGNWRLYWITSAMVVVAWAVLLLVSLLSLPIRLTEGNVEARWKTTENIRIGEVILHQHTVYTSLPQAALMLGLAIVLTLVTANIVVYALRRKLRRGRTIGR